MNWRDREGPRQQYRPRTREGRGVGPVSDSYPSAGSADWDHAARSYADVEPGEIEALLRVERSA